MEYFVQAASLIKKYGNFNAVNNLNLNIRAGEIYGLLGPNGAGKTTAIKMICGLLKPTAVDIYVLGKRIPDGSIARLVGYMPQETALYLGLPFIKYSIFWRDLWLPGTRN